MLGFIIIVIVVGLILFYLLSGGDQSKEDIKREQEEALKQLAEQRRIEKMNKVPFEGRRCFGCKNAKVYNDDVEPMLFICHREEINGIIEEKRGCPYYDPMLGSFIK